MGTGGDDLLNVDGIGEVKGFRARVFGVSHQPRLNPVELLVAVFVVEQPKGNRIETNPRTVLPHARRANQLTVFA